MKQVADIIISGDVQGVGYRYFARSTALSRGLTGWARNNPDGTVEIEVEGEKETIEEFIDALKNRHPWARVDSVDIVWKKFDGKYQNFFIK